MIGSHNSLVGSFSDDRIGYSEYTPSVYLAAGGRYVVRSYHWNNRQGAWTPASESMPLTGVLSVANSYLGHGGYHAGLNKIIQEQSDCIRLLPVDPLTAPLTREQWRQTHFGTTANSGDAADSFDFDGDGLMNIVEYAFGLAPKVLDASSLPGPRVEGAELVVRFNQPAGVTGISYGAQWSATMEPASWQGLPETGGNGAHVFRIPFDAERKFLRLTVTPN